jgi:hypothetical protein
MALSTFTPEVRDSLSNLAASLTLRVLCGHEAPLT